MDKNNEMDEARKKRWQTTGGAVVPVDINKIEWANRPSKPDPKERFVATGAGVMVEHKELLYEMPEETYVRSAQIPVTRERYEFLSNDGKPIYTDKWIIVLKDDHVLIYDRKSRYCIYVATLIMFDNKESDDSLVAVISEIKINRNNDQRPKGIVEEEDFDIVANLIMGDDRPGEEE